MTQNKCRKCGYDGSEGWLLSNPPVCPKCGKTLGVDEKGLTECLCDTCQRLHSAQNKENWEEVRKSIIDRFPYLEPKLGSAIISAKDKTSILDFIEYRIAQAHQKGRDEREKELEEAVEKLPTIFPAHEEGFEDRTEYIDKNSTLAIIKSR